MVDTMQDTAFNDHPTVDLGTRTVLVTADLIFEPGDRLGSAIFEGYRPTHSAAWHEQRSTGYGGSDIAAVVGVSKYQTAYQLWAQRTGLVPREDDGKNVKAKKWGTLLEPIILANYAAENPGLIIIPAPPGYDMSWRHESNELQLGSPDALSFTIQTGEWGIVESKTARYDDDWRDDKRAMVPPAYYRTQGQHYLDVFGFTLCVFTVLFTGSEDHAIPMEADPDEQRINRNLLTEFHVHVTAKQPPAFQGTDSEERTVRSLHPNIDGRAVDLGEDGATLRSAYATHAAAEAQLSRAKSAVLAKMGDAKIGNVDGVHLVSRQGRKGSSPWLVQKGEK